jgi:thiamine pyrophosphokinase
MAAGGSFDVSSGILGLPKMKEDAGDYREAQLNFDMPMNSAPEMEASRYSSDAMPPGRDMMGYRNYIKMRESRGDYGALSKKSSATGAYQFIWSLHNDWIKSVTGVKSKQEFLKNPEAQEKAFDYLIEKGHKAVNVIWATGKRADHTITNITNIVSYRNKLKIVILDDHSKVFLLPNKFEKWYTKNTPISLIPIGKVSGITTQNLFYPLYNEELTIGYRTGSSNHVIKDGIVKIEHTDGDLLLMECCDN